MKNIIFTLICFVSSANLMSQRIIDPNLANGIRWQCPNCIDTANNLTESAHTLRGLTITNHISDLTGLEGFSNLTLLNISDNDISVISYLPPNLVTFHCANNRLTQLPTLPNTILYLKCSGNKLTSLPPLPQRLLLLECSHNQLSALPVLPNTLQNFYCSYNILNGLPILPNSITDMGCAVNNLTSLPVLPPNLILLSCFSNPLLKCLPKLPLTLQFLELSGTISCLPNIPTVMTILRYDGIVFNTIVMTVCTNSCGQTSGIKDNLAEKIHVFPTITEGVLHIESDNVVIEKVWVFNEIGQELMRTKDLALDISKLPSGVYFVGLQVGGVRVMKKVVKL